MVTKLFHVYDEEAGEIEGMFDSEGNLLGAWSCNDATWRGEYFGGFIQKLGFKVVSSSRADLKTKLRIALGCNED